MVTPGSASLRRRARGLPEFRSEDRRRTPAQTGDDQTEDHHSQQPARGVPSLFSCRGARLQRHRGVRRSRPLFWGSKSARSYTAVPSAEQTVAATSTAPSLVTGAARSRRSRGARRSAPPARAARRRGSAAVASRPSVARSSRREQLDVDATHGRAVVPLGRERTPLQAVEQAPAHAALQPQGIADLRRHRAGEPLEQAARHRTRDRTAPPRRVRSGASTQSPRSTASRATAITMSFCSLSSAVNRSIALRGGAARAPPLDAIDLGAARGCG